MRTTIDTTAGAGETLKAGGDKLNAMTAELYAKADGLMGARKARIATMGPSHGMSQGILASITYACARHYSADIIFDYRTQQTGASFDPAMGDVYAIGGTDTTHMATVQLPKILTAIQSGRIYDLVLICDIGYNDGYANNNASGTGSVPVGVANNIAVANALLAAGVKLVVFVGLIPFETSSTRSALWAAEANQRIKVYTSSMPGTAFCDISGLFANPNQVNNYFVKARGNVYQGHSVDGTHLSGFGKRMLAPLLVPYLKAIARERRPRAQGNEGSFDQASAYSVNILGNAGNVQGTAGLKNSSFDTGVAGIGAASRLSLNCGTTNNTAAASVVTNAADGFYRQRLTLGGSVASKGLINIAATTGGITDLNGGVLTRGYDFECVVELGGAPGTGGTGVTGLSELFVRPISASNDTPAFGGKDGGAVSDLWSDGTSETLFLYSLIPATVAANTANPIVTLFMGFTADRAPSGTIDISRWSLKRVSD